MTRRIASALTLVCAAALTAGLSACVPEGAAPAPSGSSASPSGSPSPTASAPPSTGATAADPAACLVGTWTMDQAGLESFYGDVNTLLDGSGANFTPTGGATLTLGPTGAFTWAPDAEIAAHVSGMTILVTMSGHIDGAYSATADRITSANQSADGLVVTATIDGAEVDPGAVTEQIAAAPVSDAGYTCTSDTLTLRSSLAGGTATSVLHR